MTTEERKKEKKSIKKEPRMKNRGNGRRERKGNNREMIEKKISATNPLNKTNCHLLLGMLSGLERIMRPRTIVPGSFEEIHKNFRIIHFLVSLSPFSKIFF